MDNSKSFIAAAIFSGFLLVGVFSYSPVASAQNEADAVLEEIIVTATKREQVLAEIPMSITFLDGDLLSLHQAILHRPNGGFGAVVYP